MVFQTDRQNEHHLYLKAALIFLVARGGVIWLHRYLGERRYRAHPVLYLCGDFLDLLELGLRLFERNALTIF
jgi:hypothetical protein